MHAFLRKHYRSLILCALALCAALLWWRVLFGAEGRLTVAFLNIGQGDAIYIEAPNGNQMLVDGGSGKQILAELGSVMPFADRSIDVVVGTHPDADHVGGLVPVLDRYSVSAVLEPGSNTDTATYRAFRAELQDKKIPRVLAQRGMVVDLGAGVTFTVLYPDRDTSGMETNESSIVGLLRYGSTTVLLTGDAPESVERQLVAYDGEKLRSTVLKPGHHGSRTSTSDIFVQRVRPQLAVISVGKTNRYGHPHVEVLNTLGKYGVTVLRTDQEGRVVLVSDGERVTQDTKFAFLKNIW